jgi:hypothetical protein
MWKIHFYDTPKRLRVVRGWLCSLGLRVSRPDRTAYPRRLRSTLRNLASFEIELPPKVLRGIAAEHGLGRSRQIWLLATPVPTIVLRCDQVSKPSPDAKSGTPFERDGKNLAVDVFGDSA